MRSEISSGNEPDVDKTPFHRGCANDHLQRISIAVQSNKTRKPEVLYKRKPEVNVCSQSMLGFLLKHYFQRRRVSVLNEQKKMGDLVWLARVIICSLC